MARKINVGYRVWEIDVKQNRHRITRPVKKEGGTVCPY